MVSWQRQPRQSGRSCCGVTTTWRSPPGRSPGGSSSTVGGRTVEVREPIALGHKVALVDIEPRASRSASTARSSGSPRRPIPAGAWVHVHNVKADLFERDYAFASERPPVPPGRAPHLPGLPPPRRPGRHPQLRRRHQHGELLGEHLAVHRRPVPRRRLAARTSPTSTASSRSPTRGAAACRSTGRTTTTLERVLAGFANHPERRGVRARRARLRGQLRAAHRRDARPGGAGRGQGQRRQGRAGPAAGAEHPGARGDHQDGRGGGGGGQPAPARGQLAGPGPSSRPRRSTWRWSAAGRTATRA